MVRIIKCVLGDIQLLKIKPLYINLKRVIGNTSTGYSKSASIGLDGPFDMCKWVMYILNLWPNCELLKELWDTKMLNVIL